MPVTSASVFSIPVVLDFGLQFLGDGVGGVGEVQAGGEAGDEMDGCHALLQRVDGRT